MDPDPGDPKTYGSRSGFGSVTLLRTGTYYSQKILIGEKEILGSRINPTNKYRYRIRSGLSLLVFFMGLEGDTRTVLGECPST
jgi:hypothetical protein